LQTLLKRSVVLKSLILIYNLLQYLPLLLKIDSGWLVNLLIYSRALRESQIFFAIMMPIWLLITAANIFLIALLLMWMPSVNVRYVRPVMYIGGIESLVATVFGLVFILLPSQNSLILKILGPFLVIIMHLIIALYSLERKLYQYGKRVIHYYMVKQRYNAMSGRLINSEVVVYNPGSFIGNHNSQ
jgi:hypothetical protein